GPLPPMTWDHARNLLHRAGPGSEATSVEPASVEVARAGSVCVASGKGGTGKSVVSASLADVFSRRGRALIVDAALGVGNAHILQAVTPELSFVDVVDGKRGVADIRVECRENLDLLGGGSGVSRMAGLSSWELHMLARGIEALEPDYAHLVLD